MSILIVSFGLWHLRRATIRGLAWFEAIFWTASRAAKLYNMGLNGDMAFRIMAALYMHGWAMRDWFGDGRDNE